MAQAESASAAPKVANPAPLGLAGFALTTLILSLINAGFIGDKPDKLGIVVGLAFAYGGLGQLIAGWWEFHNGNTFGAVAFSSYGGFWVSFAIFVLSGIGDAGPVIAWYLLAWGIFTFYMWIATLRGDRVVMVVFLLLWVTFVLLALGGFQSQGEGDGLTMVGGVVGILTAIAAFYGSARGVINEAWGQVVLPG